MDGSACGNGTAARRGLLAPGLALIGLGIAGQPVFGWLGLGLVVTALVGRRGCGARR